MSPLIILAAGKSSRMGSPKGLVEFRGMKMLEYQLSQYSNAGGDMAFLILGSHVNEYYQAFNWDKSERQQLQKVNIQIIVNENVDWGQFHSVKLGLQMCQDTGALITPIDSPLPSTELIQSLERSMEVSAAVPRYNGRKGHPAWISADYASELILLDSQKNRLDQLLGDASIIESNEEDIILNLNRPEDLETKSYSKTDKSISKL